MRTKTKMKTLIITAAVFSAAGFMALPKTIAKAETSDFYMVAGASVNITDESYGGIRWTTVVEEGYTPVSGAIVADVSFGTFVVSTETYQAEKDTKNIEAMTGVVNVESDVTAANALEGEVVYYSAIKYDDIIADYMEKNSLTELTEVQETALLAEAYQLELTAVSYAEYEGVYYYATATETSRSARQVANMAILTKELENEDVGAERVQQVNSYVQTGATDFERVQLDNDSEGYLDLSELSATEVTAQEINVSGLTAVDFTDSEKVAEVLIGANKITDYTYEDGVLSVTEGSACLEAGTESWLSVFTNDGNVYSLPIIPADGVIRTAQELNDTFIVKNATGVDATPLYGYYVLGNDIVGDGNGSTYAMSNAVNDITYTNGGSSNTEAIYRDKLGGFWGTFDGRGHTISKITLYKAGTPRKFGIFGWLMDATVKNVAFDVEGVANNAGSGYLLAAQAYKTTFENIYINMKFKEGNGDAVLGWARSSTFNNVILNVSAYTGKNASARDWGIFALEYTWDHVNGSTYYGENNTFTNTYMISECMVAELNRTVNSSNTEAIAMCVDGANWVTPTVGTSKNYTESGIKRYLTMADMFDNKYYNEDGTENANATKVDNDWTVFDSQYWNVNEPNKTISWK